MIERFPELEPVELVAGLAFGTRVSAVEPLPRAEPGQAQLRRALEDAVLPALERQPCVVSFSGGRDSSAVLVAAVHVARREGLPLPIVVTLEFDAPRSKETEWQMAVIRHLAIDDWRRIELTEEMELLGDVAQGMLSRHGIPLHSSLHVQVPILEVARGGSVLTGLGGDEIFQRWLWSRRGMVVYLRRNRNRFVAGQLVTMLLPPPARRAAAPRWRGPRLPWLTERAVAEVARPAVEQAASYVPTFQRVIDAYWASRNTELLHGTLGILSSAGDVTVVSPFATRDFVAAVRATVPPSGFRSRTDAMRDLVGDLLPADSVTRSTKAVFNEAFWGPQSQSFARDWDGTGVPTDLVDVDALRTEWSGQKPSMRSWPLLQSAWLNCVSHVPPSGPSPRR